MLSLLYVIIVDVNWSYLEGSRVTPGQLSIKYHTWCANISDTLVKEACSSQVVNQCSGQGPLFCHWSVCPSGLWSNRGTARAWQYPGAGRALTRVVQVRSPWVAIHMDGTGPNPWWMSTSDPEMKAALFSVSSSPAGEPDKSEKAQKSCRVTLFGIARGKDVLKAYNFLFFFFFSLMCAPDFGRTIYWFLGTF